MRPAATCTDMRAILLSALMLTACAGTGRAPASLKPVAGRSCQEPEELLDVLTRFSTLVQKHDYHHAISLLVPADQARMLGPDGKVPENIKKQLHALDFKSLATDRRIDLAHGRLQGVFDCLPCLDEGPAVNVPREARKPVPPAEPGSAEGIEKARKEMAAVFYRKIQMGLWQEASGLVHPDEWAVFEDEEGNLTELNERRMQAIGMLLESEKKFFLDANGKPRPDRVAKLKALDRSEWQKLYLYHDVLLGAAEAAIGFDNL